MTNHLIHMYLWLTTAPPDDADTSESGQGLVEYALILLLIAIAVIGSVTAFGTELLALYTRINTELPF